MINKINELLAEIEAFAPQTAADVEAFRIKILGKKGVLGALMEEFKAVPAEQKRELGQRINQVKNLATERINTLKEEFGNAAALKASKIDDMTRPGSSEQVGSFVTVPSSSVWGSALPSVSMQTEQYLGSWQVASTQV